MAGETDFPDAQLPLLIADAQTEPLNSVGGVPQALPSQETVTADGGGGFEFANQSPAVAFGGDGAAADSTVGERLGGMEKRKRGRPRKLDADNNAAAAAAASAFSGCLASHSEPSEKRGRGRPKGSGKLQIFGSADWNFSSTAGKSFTPFVETVNTGEDVVAKIFSYSPKGSRSVCVLSATGPVSSVIIRPPGSFQGNLRYEGRFEILSLSGSYAYSETAGPRHKTCMLTVSLANPDGQVFGGALAGSLIAAGPVQLVVGSFKQILKRDFNQQKQSVESSIAAGVAAQNSDIVMAPAPVASVPNGEENCGTPTSELSEPNNGVGDIIIGQQNMNIVSTENVCWNDTQPSQPMSDQRTSPDINASIPEV